MLRVLDGKDTVADIQREKSANHLADTKFSINDDGDEPVKSTKPVKGATKNTNQVNNFNPIENTAKNANNNASKPKVPGQNRKKNGVGGKGQKSFGDLLAIYNKPGKVSGKGKK